MLYQAHCGDCGEHFETRSGTCPGCRTDDNVRGEDSCADRGCQECQELQEAERRAGEELEARRYLTLCVLTGGKAA